MASSPAFVKSHSSTPADHITKLIKHHYKAPPAVPYCPEKIWTKTKDLMIRERSEDLWEKHYIRHHENMSRGYHSVPWEKYKPIGEEVELNTQNLVLKTMSKCLDNKIWSRVCQRDVKNEKRLTTLPPIGLPTSTDPTRPSSSSSFTKTENLKSSCYNFFRDHNREYRKVITNVKAGQPYEEYVRVKQEMQGTSVDEGESDNDMVLMSLTNLHLGIPDVHMKKDDSENEEEEDNEDEIDVKKVQKAREKRKSTFEAVKEKHLVIGMGGRRMTIVVDNRPLTMREDRQWSATSDLVEEGSSDKLATLICCPSGITMKKERIKKDHLLYLEAILMLLTSLQNMKTKEIKSKNPLSIDAVKALRKEPTPPNSNLGGGRESKQGSHNVTPRWQIKSRKMSVTGFDSNDLEQQLRRGTMEQVANLTGNITGIASRVKRKSIWPASQKVGYDHQILETWEDLLNVEEKKTNFAIQSKIIMKALLWSRRKALTVPGVSSSSTVQETSGSQRSVVPRIRKDLLSADGHRQQVHTSIIKKMPIWQMVALDKPMRKESSRKRTSLDPLNVVQHNRRALNKIKQDILQDMDLELQKQDREKLAVFKLKYGAFEDMSPVFEEHMSRLKMSTKDITRNIDICDVKPSKWYEDLEERTYSITGPYDKDINHALRQIGRFSTMDSKTIAFAKAKLCLLMMSLPAYEILTIATQKGIKYVMEVILMGDTHQLEEWFQHRKIHLVVKSDVSTPSRNTPTKDQTD